MTAVSPTSADIDSARSPLCSIPRISRVCRWLRKFAGGLPGEYTVAKLDAFDQFRRHTTPLQAVGILLLTPMTCFLANFLVESIPLNDPATGFHGSLPFLLRNFLTATVVTMVPFRVKSNCVPQLDSQSWKLALGFGILLGAISTCTIAAIIYIVDDFPVPSVQFSPMIPMAIVGRLIEHLLRKPETKSRLEQIDLWLGMVVAPILVYPIFMAIFMGLKPSQQLWFSLLLPVIKHLLRFLLWFVVRHDLDMITSVTCTIGHFYHVLFTAMCLQNAKSLETLITVGMVNTIHMLLNCRELLRGATQINASQAKLMDSSDTMTEDIISTALKIAQIDQVARCLHRKRPSRFISQYPKYQGAEFIKRHQELLTYNATTREDTCNSVKIEREPNRHFRTQYTDSVNSTPNKNPIFHNTAQILPAIQTRPDKHRATHDRLASTSFKNDTKRKEEFVRSVTSTLHQTEFILLRSYITIVVLLFYGLYLIFIFWSPNRSYFATMASLTSFDAVAAMILHLLLLCAVEFIFLSVYLMMIWRSIGVSCIYQLAFVLWSQRVVIQGNFIMLSLMILGFPLDHYGNGAIFRLHTDV